MKKIIMLLTLLFLLSTPAFASTKILNKSTDLFSPNYNKETIKFTITEPMYLTILLRVTDDEDYKPVTKGGLSFILKNSKGEQLQKDFLNGKLLSEVKSYSTTLHPTGKIFPADTYSCILNNNMDDTLLKVNVKIIGDTTLSDKIDFTSSAKLPGDDMVKIGKLNNCPYVKSIKSSNTKVIKDNVYNVDDKGYLYIRTKKSGTATVTFKLGNGKSIKKKFTVGRPLPNYKAWVLSDYVSNKRIRVKITNCGISRMKIKSGTVDYDIGHIENLKLDSPVEIPAGQTKIITFKAKTDGKSLIDVNIGFHFQYYNAQYRGYVCTGYNPYSLYRKYTATSGDKNSYRALE